MYIRNKFYINIEQYFKVYFNIKYYLKCLPLSILILSIFILFSNINALSLTYIIISAVFFPLTIYVIHCFIIILIYDIEIRYSFIDIMSWILTAFIILIFGVFSYIYWYITIIFGTFILNKYCVNKI